jgi:hypothetical protein
LISRLSPLPARRKKYPRPSGFFTFPLLVQSSYPRGIFEWIATHTDRGRGQTGFPLGAQDGAAQLSRQRRTEHRRLCSHRQFRIIRRQLFQAIGARDPLAIIEEL